MIALYSTYVVLLAVAVAQGVFYFPQLPEVLASHFDGAGHPNGWSTKGQYFTLSWGVLTLVLGIFLGLPTLFRRLPVSLINLPHRDYWLAPERRDESCRVLGRYFLVFGIASLLLILVVNQLVIRANLSEAPQLSNAILPILGVYGLLLVVWLFSLMRRFRIS